MTKQEQSKQLIKERFWEKGESPSDAKTIASQLKQNQLELYTETSRFIFELLQNADDMPFNNEGVNILLHKIDDYLLFLHNGKAFDKDDVISITDSAQSNKNEDITKIGYKGIGFKSVFTDSKAVYIKSGDYAFKFDKKAEIYKNFWELYKTTYEFKNEAGKQQFQQAFQEKEHEYKKIDNIPWQIKPIWVDEFPEELSKFFSENHRVKIALKIGKNTFMSNKYEEKIQKLFNEPRFLLFLKNVNIINVKLPKYEKVIKLNKKSNELTVNSNNQFYTYRKTDYPIEISNQAFKEAIINISIRNENENTYFIDNENDEKINNIPDRLSKMQETIISFATQLKENSIQNITDAILFNYLPTSDSRFDFPFLVNADFITKSDREFILEENRWNWFLFYQIGYYHLKWISEIADNEKYRKSYLRLLKSGMFTNEKPLHEAFLIGFEKAKNEIAFLIGENNEKLLTKDIIIDNTKISEISINIFYALFGKDKTLLHSDLNKSHLLSKSKREYLELKEINNEELINKINDKKDIFLKEINSLENDKYKEFLGWINDLFGDKKNEEIIKEIEFKKLQFLKFTNKSNKFYWQNLQILKENELYFFLSEKTEKIKDILKKLSFWVSCFQIDEYQNLKNNVDLQNSYLTNDNLLFEKINAQLSNNQLTAEQKNILFQFINSLDLEKEKYEIVFGLQLFSNENGVTNLHNLISNNFVKNEKYHFLKQFCIKKEEENECEEIKNYLVNEENIFQYFYENEINLSKIQTKIKLNLEESVKDFYDNLLHFFKKSKNKSIEIKNKNVFFINYEQGFFSKTDIFFNDNIFNFIGHDIEKYKILKKVIETEKNLFLPSHLCLDFIKKLKISFGNQNITDKIKASFSLDKNSLELFLSFLDYTNERFFDKFIITKTDENFYQIIKSNDIQYFSENQNLINYLPENNFYLLPKELKNFENSLGLLNENEVINKILRHHDFNIEFAKIIRSCGDKQILTWLRKATKIDIDINQPYDKNSAEYCLIESLIKISNSEEDLSTIKQKIFISNNLCINKLNYENDIEFNFGNNEIYELKLSEILILLVDLKERASFYKKFISAFPALSEDIKSKLLKAKKAKNNQILNSLLQNVKILNAHQLAFIVCYLKEKPSIFDQIKDFKVKTKADYSKLNKNNLFYFEDKSYINDTCILSEEYQEIQEILKIEENQTKIFYKLKFRIKPYLDEDGNFLAFHYLQNIENQKLIIFKDIFDLWQKNKTIYAEKKLSFENIDNYENTFFKIFGFKPSKKVFPSKYAYKNEYISDEYLEILNSLKKDENEVKNFFKFLSVEIEDSAVVRLRKMFVNNEKIDVQIINNFHANDYFLLNTLHFLASENFVFEHEKHFDIIKNIYDRISDKIDNLSKEKQYPLLFSNFENDKLKYQFDYWNLKTVFYYLDLEEETFKQLFDIAKAKGYQFVHEICLKSFHQNYSSEPKIQSTKIKENRKIYSEQCLKDENNNFLTWQSSYYQNWKLKEKYPIRFFENEVLFIDRFLNENVGNAYAEGNTTYHKKVFYFNKKYNEDADIQSFLKKNIATEDFNNFLQGKGDVDEKLKIISAIVGDNLNDLEKLLRKDIPLKELIEMAEQKERTAKKVENGKSDSHQLGKKGEKYIFEMLKKDERFADENIDWLNERDGKESREPYDIKIVKQDEKGHDITYFIECKATTKTESVFYLTKNEWNLYLRTLKNKNEKYLLFRIYNLQNEDIDDEISLKNAKYIEYDDIMESLKKGKIFPPQLKTT